MRGQYASDPILRPAAVAKSETVFFPRAVLRQIQRVFLGRKIFILDVGVHEVGAFLGNALNHIYRESVLLEAHHTPS